MGNDYDYENNEEIEESEENYNIEQTSRDKFMNFLKENKTLVVGISIFFLLIMAVMPKKEEGNTNIKISSENLIFVLSPFHGAAGSLNSIEGYSVFKIKIGNVIGNKDNPERYRDWTITDLTDTLFGSLYTN